MKYLIKSIDNLKRYKTFYYPILHKHTLMHTTQRQSDYTSSPQNEPPVRRRGLDEGGNDLPLLGDDVEVPRRVRRCVALRNTCPGLWKCARSYPTLFRICALLALVIFVGVQFVWIRRLILSSAPSTDIPCGAIRLEKSDSCGAPLPPSSDSQSTKTEPTTGLVRDLMRFLQPSGKGDIPMVNALDASTRAASAPPDPPVDSTKIVSELSQSVTKVLAEVKAQSSAKAGTKAEVKAETKPRAKADIMMKNEVKVSTKQNANANAEVKANSEAKADAKAKAKAKAKADAKAKAKTKAKARAKADTTRVSLMASKQPSNNPKPSPKASKPPPRKFKPLPNTSKQLPKPSPKPQKSSLIPPSRPPPPLLDPRPPLPPPKSPADQPYNAPLTPTTESPFKTKQSRVSIPQDVVEQRRLAIVEEFKYAYEHYEARAFGHDEVDPVTGNVIDAWGGFGATLVDSLDTLMLMGLNEHVARARKHVATIDWKSSDEGISFLEVVIRYLGGLLGAYEFSRDKLYLTKAKELADSILFAYDTSMGFPRGVLQIKTAKGTNFEWAGKGYFLAEIATHQLEFAYLSYHTGDPKYYDVARYVVSQIREQRGASLLPGLYPSRWSPDGKAVPRSRISMGGQSDSFYEYLLKLYLLTGYQDEELLQMYVDAMESMIRHITLRVPVNVPSDLAKKYELDSTFGSATRDSSSFIQVIATFVGEANNGDKVTTNMEHLACFVGGMLALGATHAARAAMSTPPSSFWSSATATGGVNRPQHLADAELNAQQVWKAMTASSSMNRLMEHAKLHMEIAEEITTLCYLSYATSKSGLGPDTMYFVGGRAFADARLKVDKASDQAVSIRQRYASQLNLVSKWNSLVSGPSSKAPVPIGMSPEQLAALGPEPALSQAYSEDVKQLIAKAKLERELQKRRSPKEIAQVAAAKGVDPLLIPPQDAKFGVAKVAAKLEHGHNHNHKHAHSANKQSKQATKPSAQASSPDRVSNYIRLANSVEQPASVAALDPKSLTDASTIVIKTIPSYLLRPETVESIFVMYRVTGDDKYREWGWKIFEALRIHCKAPFGYSGLNHVDKSQPRGKLRNPSWTGRMETFFFAETLKYLYLLYSPNDVVPLDKYVFNTEAHPLGIIPPSQNILKIPTPKVV